MDVGELSVAVGVGLVQAVVVIGSPLALGALAILAARARGVGRLFGRRILAAVRSSEASVPRLPTDSLSEKNSSL